MGHDRDVEGGHAGDEDPTAAPEDVSDDPAGEVVRGYPGARVSHTETGGEGPDDPAAGVLTGYPGDRTPSHLGSDEDDDEDPVASVLRGYPGARVSHTETGAEGPDDPAAGDVTGYPGARTRSHTSPHGKGADSEGLDRT
jgi:hypothetical protein